MSVHIKKDPLPSFCGRLLIFNSPLKAEWDTLTIYCFRLGNKHIKGKLKKLKQELLGAGPVEGALEQAEMETDSGYDMTVYDSL